MKMICNCGGSLWEIKDKKTGAKYYQCGTCHAKYDEPPKNPRLPRKK